MTIPQAVELLRGSSPEDVLAEQVDELRALIERTPACVALLGGQTRVDLFLEQARLANEQRKAAAMVTMAVVEPSTDHPPVQSGAAQRHLLELGVLAGGVLVAVVVGCIYFFGLPGRTDRLRKPARVTLSVADKQSAVDESTNTPRTQMQATASGPSDQNTSSGTDAETWKGWQVESSPGAIALSKTVWSIDDPTKPDAATVLVLGSKPSSLRGEKQIDADRQWLRIELLTAEAPATGALTVLVDGKTVSRVNLEPALIGAPLLVSLKKSPGPRGEAGGPL